MERVASIEVVIVAVLVTSCVFAWDGLVRRHIRLTRGLLQARINLRGVPATLLGLVGLCVAALAFTATAQQSGYVVRACRRSAACIAHTLLLPVFTTWQTVVCLLIVVLVFGPWLRGALDLHGPYRRVWLAPGVWDSEKDILARVSTRCQEAHVAMPEQDSVLAVAGWVRQRTSFISIVTRKNVTQGMRGEVTRLASVLLASAGAEELDMQSDALNVVVPTVVEYYRDLYERAAEAYPWLRAKSRRRRHR